MGPVSPANVTERLFRLVGVHGSQPLLTHYGPAGARTELSVASFANWVSKTCNLLDELGHDPGSSVVLPVLAERPGHWMGLVWPFAVWRAGGAVEIASRTSAEGADLAVIGYTDLAAVADVTVACSLDPWARPLDDVPPGVLDFSTEALAQPDVSFGGVVDANAPAWREAASSLRHDEIGALEPIADRVLVVADTPWTPVAMLCRVILGGGSLVVVEPGAADPDAVAAAEKARPA